MKIAIIGAGVGGSSLAYYLSKNNNDFKITIFEKNKITGGRARDINFNGKIIETGASFFHSANKNINELVEITGLRKEILPRSTFGLWNGDKLLFQTVKSDILSNIKLFFRFGYGLLKLQKAISNVKSNIQNFYREDKTFKSIPEMIKLLGFEKLYSSSIQDALFEYGISDKIIAEIAIPANRYIYHVCGKRQMNGFAGFVSLIASDGEPIYYLYDGNKTLSSELIKISGAELKLGQKVDSITSIDNKYSVKTGETEELFDVVVISTPLEIAKIDLNINNNKPKMNRKYFPYTKTIILGKPKPEFFGTKNMPDMLMVSEKLIKETDIMYGLDTKGNDYWTISSGKEIDDKILAQMFDIRDKKVITVNYTYPELEPIKFNEFEPLILDHNLYYANSVDTLSPTMETSIIVSRNISKLIQSNINK